MFQLHAHAVHDAQVQAAQLSVLVARVEVIERPGGIERPAQSARSPLAGRSIVKTGFPASFACASALSFAARMRSIRFSTSRTLVRYSSSFALSLVLTCLLKSSARCLTRSRMLLFRSAPRFSNKLSNASDG